MFFLDRIPQIHHSVLSGLSFAFSWFSVLACCTTSRSTTDKQTTAGLPLLSCGEQLRELGLFTGVPQ